MSKKFNQIIAVMICAAMLLSGIAVLSAHTDVNPSSGYHGEVNFPYTQLAEFFIVNNLSAPTPPNFDEHIVVNSSNYAAFENPNLSNVFFTVFGDVVVPSWLQSGNSYTAYNTSYWLRINNSIPTHDTLEIFMDAGTVGNNILNNYSIGEAPQLTSDYGLYDDGSHVFNFYDNFAGTHLNTSKWIPLNSNYAVNNGITFTAGNSYITSRIQYIYPGFAEAYGVMHSPSTTDSTSYDLGGVGFGKQGMDFTKPVVTSGWAEGHTNGPGLTVYNGNGPYQYNYSHSINMLNNHTFGVGFINDSYTIGTVDNVYQNSSRVSYLIPSGQMLNVTLGFQANDYPTFNNFRYIFEFNSTQSGINLPFTFQSYNVALHENGLPPGTLWGVNVLNLDGFLGNDGYSSSAYYNLTIPNGHYNFTVSSGSPDYRPVNTAGNFTVNGKSIAINVPFEHVKFVVSFRQSGLPAGTVWSVEVYGGSLNKTTFYSTTEYNNVSLMNGSYTAILNITNNGYIPLPDIMSFSVGGQQYVPIMIFYESPSNASYIRPLTSFNPLLRQQYNGYNEQAAQIGATNMITSIAVDNSTNVLFSVVSTMGIIIAYNITTGNYLPNITLGASSVPIFSYYDPANGFLYVSNEGTGQLTIINAKTMSIVKNVTLANLRHSAFNIAQSPQSTQIYAFGFNSTNYSNGTVYILQPSGTVVGEHNFTLLQPQFGFGPYPVVLSPAVYDQNMLVANGSGIDVLNLSTGSERYYPAPTYYEPSLLYPYGSFGDYLVSNEANNTTLLFNAKNFTYLPGPDVKGQILSGFTDPMNGYMYLSTVSNFSPYSGNISVVSPSNNSVLTSVYSFVGSSSIVFSYTNQSILALDFAGDTNVIHTYAKVFTISFFESGLPGSNNWYVNISGEPSSGPLQPGTTYSVNLTNQTYSYTIGTSDKEYRASGGTFDANSAKSIQVDFVPVNYQVTFTESGLPSSTIWKVDINGTQYSSSTDRITTSLMNGTYNYSVNSVAGYVITNGTGSVRVDGSSVSVDIKFSPALYQVTISETGLPVNATWTITVSGHAYNVTGSKITLYLANGTYTYSVSSVKGYSIVNSTGNITVTGHSVSVSITFSPVPGVSYTIYIEIGILLAIIAGGLSIFLWRRTHKR